MSPKKLFLAHHSVLSGEITALAQMLRLHGLAPWVDKEGGFRVADHFPTEARRAIREDCFGWLLYASPGAFESDFIREVEFDEARRARDDDARYLLFAVPRGISFAELKSLSVDSFGFDLSTFHTSQPLLNSDSLDDAFRVVAREILHAYTLLLPSAPSVALQFSTRELLADEPDEVFTINAVDLLRGEPTDSESWDHILHGLRVLKGEISRRFGRPVVTINGSKHLTAAFLFGRVFTRYDLRIRYSKDEYWTSVGEFPRAPLFDVTIADGPANGQLFVELATLHKNVSRDIDGLLASRDLPSARLQMVPRARPLTLDARLCRAAAHQVYEAIDQLAARLHITDVHIFAAAPQALLMMLGAKFSGLPTTHLYEWTGSSYVHSAIVPPGVL